MVSQLSSLYPGQPVDAGDADLFSVVERSYQLRGHTDALPLTTAISLPAEFNPVKCLRIHCRERS